MKHTAIDALAGGSVGLFLGLLVGMSVSPVVGIVVSGITGLLAVLLGIGSAENETESVKSRKFKLSSRARMIAFGLAACIGLSGGLWARTHNLMSPSRADDVKAWTVAGWSEQDARALHVYSELGLVPSGLKQSEGGGKSPGASSVLYSNYRDQCRNLDPHHFKDASEALNAWKLEMGVWGAMAEVLQKSASGNLSSMLESSWSKLCEEQ